MIVGIGPQRCIVQNGWKVVATPHGSIAHEILATVYASKVKADRASKRLVRLAKNDGLDAMLV